MTIDDVLSAELATGRLVPTAVTGEPYESWRVISDDGRSSWGSGRSRPARSAARRTASTSRCTSSPAAARSRTATVS